MSIAFYAPMKPPGHPTPSGDRRMARLLMQALDRAGYPVFLASDWRVYDGQGDVAVQEKLLDLAALEVERVLAVTRPTLWFTYHCYYKSPDLIGPRVAARLGIPYVIAEASRAKKRLGGPWDTFAREAEDAIDAADVLFAMTAHDRAALDRDRTGGQRIVDLPPFLDVADFSAPKPPSGGGPLRLLTVAMMRAGAKMESYRRLAAALERVETPYHLTIVGFGPCEDEIRAMFPAATIKGAMDETALRAEYAAADLFVWPGVEEAYGMVYLEAQASGLPVVAEDHPGPRSVIAAPLLPPDNPAAFAAAIEGTHTPPGDYVARHHNLDRAASILRDTLGQVP